MTSLPQVRASEEEANRRIQAAVDRVRAAEQEGEAAAQHIQDQYEKQAIAQKARHEEVLHDQNTKGYEQLRTVQRQQHLDQQRTKANAELSLQALNDHYRDTIMTEDSRGRNLLHNLQKSNAHSLAYEQAQGQEQLDSLRNQHITQSEKLRQENEKQNTRLTQEHLQRYQKNVAENEAAESRAQEHLETRYHQHVDQLSNEVNRVESRGNQELHRIRQGTSEKLAAYRERQEDPFYKLIRMEGQLQETDDAFVLTMQVPSYEQDHISVAIRGDAISVSGYRRNEETLHLESGHVQETSAFQSFRETFPLAWPVEARGLSREFVGEQMIVRVPKKNQFAFKRPQSEPPERLRAEPPRFPAYLPSLNGSRNLMKESTKAETDKSGDSSGEKPNPANHTLL